VKQYPLQSTDNLVLHNVAAAPATLQGKSGLRLTISDAAKREQGPVDQLATIKDLEFSNGVIEVELAGAPAPDAPEGARGFVGIAFRLQPDNKTGPLPDPDMIPVRISDTVTKGKAIGRSGMTGLAGGDHLHFTMLVNGQAVNAVEWWDTKWMQDRVLRKVREAGGSVVGTDGAK